MIQSNRKRSRASTSRAARRATAGLAAIALASTSFALTSPTFATATVAVERTSGLDRYLTSIEVSKATFTSPVADVVFASGADYPDGLSAAALAGQVGAPILLVPATGTLTAALTAEITRLGATRGHIVGGTASVSADVATQLEATSLTTVARYAGADRYSTSKAVTTALTTIGTDNGKLTAFVASGGNFADALAASGPAYAVKMPLILTNSFALNDNAKNALTDKLIKKVIVVGGVNSISAGIVTEMEAMGIEVVRFSGATRSDTAANLATYIAGDADYGFTKTGVVLTQGLAFPDALSAGPHSAKQKHPILYVDLTVPAATEAYLTANAATMANIRLVGGPNGIPESVIAPLKAAAGGTTVVAGAYTVTAGDTVVTPDDGSRTYTISGLTAGTSIRIALVVPASVDAGAFSLDATQRLATLTAPAASLIDEINGVAVTAAPAINFTPTSTTLTFQVKGAGPEEVVPVVFSRADGNDSLKVNLSGAAREAFGLGGKVTFKAADVAALPEEATAAIAATAVSEVYGTTGFAFGVGPTDQYLMKDHDTYQLGGSTITKAQFQSILGVADTVDGNYRRASTASAPSTFNITTDLVGAGAGGLVVPTMAVSASTPGRVTVTYGTGPQGTPNGTTYELQRRQTTTLGGGTGVIGAAGNWATVNSTKATALGSLSYAETLPAGFYQYRVRAVSPAFAGTTAGEQTSAASIEVTSTSAALAAPKLRRLYLTANPTGINVLSKGDVFKVVFDQPLTTPSLGAFLTVGGQSVTYTAASSEALGAATFAVNGSAEVVDGVSLAAGTVLTVTMLADAVAGTTAFGTAALTGATGIGNVAGPYVDIVATNETLTRDVLS